MKTIAIANSIIFIVIGWFVVTLGFDIKKPTNWLYGLYGFLTGVLIGISYSDLKNAVIVGVLFFFIIMFGGATTHMHRERWEKKD